MSTYTTTPPTARQISFATALIKERPMYADVMNYHLPVEGAPELKSIADLSRSDLSKVIDDLLKQPKETKTPAGFKPKAKSSKSIKIDKDGMYRNPETGDIIRVQVAKQGSGNLYAKILHTTFDERTNRYRGHFVYAPGLVYDIDPSWRMSLDEAKEYGKLYSICCVCAADLTDEVSIAEGIGPVCGGRVKSKKQYFG